jgi:hypothetical protein
MFFYEQAILVVSLLATALLTFFLAAFLLAFRYLQAIGEHIPGPQH